MLQALIELNSVTWQMATTLSTVANKRAGVWQWPRFRRFLRVPNDQSHRADPIYRSRRFQSEIIELCVREV